MLYKIDKNGYVVNEANLRKIQPYYKKILQEINQLYIAADSEIEDFLFKLVMLNINDDGTLKHRPRNQREELYPGFKPFIKKF